ncbi:MAG: hypothetical protein IJC71_00560 [Clostridia bacterium]|nr:hypothetical protein [Clostridia bacterium]
MKSKTLIILTIAIMMFFAIASPIIQLLGSYGVIENHLATKNLFVTETYVDEDAPLAAVRNAVEDVKTGLKNIYANCIPFYSVIVNSVQSADLALLNLSDTFITEKLLSYDTIEEPSSEETTDSLDASSGEDSAAQETEPVPEKPKVRYTASRLVSGRPNIFKIEPLKVLERVEGASAKELEILLERQLDYLDRLYNLYPDLNYYVYMGTRLQETEIYDDMIKMPKSTRPYLETFIEKLNPAYKFDYLRIDTPEDRVNKQFRTDHHWNAYGALEGYKQIMAMIYEDSPEVGEAIDYNIVKVEGAKWFGSMTSGLTDEAYKDDFHIFDLSDMPGNSSDARKLRRLYEAYTTRSFDERASTDYYGAYFGNQEQFHFESGSGRNLLILGDSYSWAVNALIAAHFDHTYCFNKPWMTNGVKHDYKGTVENNNITDVVIILYSSRLLFGLDSTDFDNILD